MSAGRLMLAAAAAVLLAGCGAASGAEPPAVLGAKESAAAPTKQAEAKAPVVSPMKFLKKNYSDAAWYPHITSAHQVGSVTWIETDLGPGATKAGAKICSAVSAWQFKKYHEFKGVTVRSADGNRLSRRVYLKDPC